MAIYIIMHCLTCGTLNCLIPSNATLKQLEEMQRSTGGFMASLQNPLLNLLGISCQSHIESRKKQVSLNLTTAEKQLAEMAEMERKETGSLEKRIHAMRVELGLECEVTDE
jgi:hypothetical protein